MISEETKEAVQSIRHKVGAVRRSQDDRSLGLRRVENHIRLKGDRFSTILGQIKALPENASEELKNRLNARSHEWQKPSINKYFM